MATILNRLLGLLLLLFILPGCTTPTPEPTPILQPAPSPTASPLLPPPPAAATAFLPTQFPVSLQTGTGENLALKRRVKVSHASYGHGGPAAVDGNPRTSWIAGMPPAQWIEIDLGAEYDIQEIHLLPYLDRPGVTVHQIFGEGPFTGGYEILYTFESQISDSPLLAYPSTGLWRAIRLVRIETSFSPAPIGWREIEIIKAGQ